MFNRDRPSHRTALSDNAESSPGPANPRADAPAARALRPRRGWRRAGRRLSLTQVLVRRRPATGIDHATRWYRPRRSAGSRSIVGTQTKVAEDWVANRACGVPAAHRPGTTSGRTVCRAQRRPCVWESARLRAVGSLYSRVTKYTPSALLNPREHRLTESFAATLEHSGELASLLVSDWLAIDPRKESCGCERSGPAGVASLSRRARRSFVTSTFKRLSVVRQLELVHVR